MITSNAQFANEVRDDDRRPTQFETRFPTDGTRLLLLEPSRHALTTERVTTLRDQRLTKDTTADDTSEFLGEIVVKIYEAQDFEAHR